MCEYLPVLQFVVVGVHMSRGHLCVDQVDVSWLYILRQRII